MSESISYDKKEFIVGQIKNKTKGLFNFEEQEFLRDLGDDLINLLEYFDTEEKEAKKLNKIYLRLPLRLRESILALYQG